MVTACRLLFAVIQRWFPSRLAYHVLPFVLAGAFVLISVCPRGPRGGHTRLRAGRVRLLGAAAADDQLRAGRLASMSAAMAGLVSRFTRWATGCRVRRGAAAARRAHAARPVRRERRRGRGPGGALAGRCPRPPVTPVRAPPAAAPGDGTIRPGTHQLGTAQLGTTQLGTTGRSPMLWHSSQRWLKHGTSPATRPPGPWPGRCRSGSGRPSRRRPAAARRCRRRR